jgi:hypothetical protein
MGGRQPPSPESATHRCSDGQETSCTRCPPQLQRHCLAGELARSRTRRGSGQLWPLSSQTTARSGPGPGGSPGAGSALLDGLARSVNSTTSVAPASSAAIETAAPVHPQRQAAVSDAIVDSVCEVARGLADLLPERLAPRHQQVLVGLFGCARVPGHGGPGITRSPTIYRRVHRLTSAVAPVCRCHSVANASAASGSALIPGGVRSTAAGLPASDFTASSRDRVSSTGWGAV